MIFWLTCLVGYPRTSAPEPDYLVTILKVLDLAEKENVSNHVILSIYNDYYITCKNMKKRILQFSLKDQNIAYKLLKNSKKDFLSKMKWSYLKNAPFRTKVKFLLFMLSIR